MFNIDFTFLWTAINLLIIYLVVRKFLFKRLTGFMDKRSASIAADIENARCLKEEGDKYRIHHEQILDVTSLNRREILEEANRKATNEYEAIVREAKIEAGRIIIEARAEAAREREQMLEDLRNDVATIAIAAATKVIEANMDNESNRMLVNRFLSDTEVA